MSVRIPDDTYRVWQSSYNDEIIFPNKVIYKWLVIGADCHNVEGNRGEVGANLHSTAQINTLWQSALMTFHFMHL